MKKTKIKKSIAILTSAAILLTGISVSAAKKNITFVKSKQTVYVGKKITLKISVPKKYKKQTSKIKWSSSNKKVAVVNKKGVVTAKKTGKTVIKAKFYGTTAKCTVTVKKKTTMVKPTAKPEKTTSPVPTESSTPAPTESAAPTESSEPSETEIPAESSTPVPTESAAPTESSAPAPTESAAPTESSTSAPTESTQPTQTPDAGKGKLTPVSGNGAVAAYGVVKINGEVRTVYLVNRDYDGSLKISFKGNVFEQRGSVKDGLVMLDSLYVTKTNSAGTIKVSRKSPDTVWTISDLVDNKDYYFYVERRNTYDTSYANCGAIYFIGDVSDVVSVY